MAYIQTRMADQIGTIAFDCYAKRNALSLGLVDETIAALDQMKREKARAVVLCAAGANKVWSAGHDVSELPVADKDPLSFSDPLERLIRAVRQFPAPVIAMVHGSVWGGALDLVVNCDIVISDETGAFAITPAKLGLPYNASGIQHFMSRLPLNIVKEMFFSANLLSVERAEKAGIVNMVVPAGELEARTYELAKTIASRSPQANAAFKEQVRILSEAVAINPTTFEYIQDLRRKVYSGTDYHEGINAFLQKRAPKF